MGDYVNVKELFGCDVFNDSVMQERLPKKVYKELKKTIEEGKELSMEIADVVAHEMKEWAIEKGATHYSHWFQPLTGVTAEKHDAFITAPMQQAEPYVSQLLFVPTQERHWIRKHRSFVLWKPSIHRHYDFSDFLEIVLLSA